MIRSLISHTTFLTSALLAVVCYADPIPFTPTTSLKSWYTSRESLDIELIATRGVSPEERRIEPARSLRFRMERAYLTLLLPGTFSPANIVFLSLDMPTGLPASLLVADQDDRSRQKNPQLPMWKSKQDFLERQLDIRFSSNAVAENLPMASLKLADCAGDALDDDLISFKKADVEYCQILSLGKRVKYVARYTDDLLLLISCQPAPVQRCEMSLPYEGFAANVIFGEMHLRSWRVILSTATEFLQKNRFKIQE